ncbi:hypothetical protein Bca101_048986 [Brassica carinata]
MTPEKEEAVLEPTTAETADVSARQMDHAQIQQKHQRPIHKWATTYGRSPKQLRRLLGPTSQNRTIKAHERNKEAEEETRGMIYTIQTGMRFSASTCPSSTPEETGRDRRTLVRGARIPAEPRRNHLFSLLLHHVGGLSHTIELSPDTTKLPTTREIIVIPALSTRGRVQSKHEITSAIEPLKTTDAHIENHLIVDLTDFTSAESFIIKTRTPPP